MIPPGKLERYWDFVAPERSGQSFDPNYQYDPRKGLERLLTCLTPDPKALTVAAMGRERYFTDGQLNRATINWLTEQGAAEPFPLSRSAAWSYIRRSADGQHIDGSLVDIGAVVKESLVPTASGYETAYHRSIAGEELVIPLVQKAIDFVYEAKQFIPTGTTEKPKYTSMTRVFSSVSSSNPSERHQLLIFDIVKLLVESNDKFRMIDLGTILRTQINTQMYHALHSLGLCGVINYRGIGKEQEGKRPSGWSNYELVDPEVIKNIDPAETLRQIQTTIPYFLHRTALERTLEYINNHPDSIYNLQNLSTEIRTPKGTTSGVLNGLATIGILKQKPEEFVGGKVHSSVGANEITRLFYELVLKPASETAEQLEPQTSKDWDIRRLDFFNSNYYGERTRKGSEEAQKIREALNSILFSNNRRMKFSEITKACNDISRRDLGDKAIGYHLNLMVTSGDLFKPERGFYQAVGESD